MTTAGLQVISRKNIGLNIGSFLKSYRVNIGIQKKIIGII